MLIFWYQSGTENDSNNIYSSTYVVALINLRFRSLSCEALTNIAYELSIWLRINWKTSKWFFWIIKSDLVLKSQGNHVEWWTRELTSNLFRDPHTMTFDLWTGNPLHICTYSLLIIAEIAARVVHNLVLQLLMARRIKIAW